MPDQMEPPDDSPQRIDKWLFFARMAKSRSLAQALVASGAVAVNGEVVEHASHMIRRGDKISLALERHDLSLVVRAPGSRRGPFEEARMLYLDTSDALGEQPRLTPFERAQRRPKT